MRVLELDDLEELLGIHFAVVNQAKAIPELDPNKVQTVQTYFLFFGTNASRVKIHASCPSFFHNRKGNLASLLAVWSEDASGDLAEELFEHGGDCVDGEGVDVDESALK